MEPNLVKHLLNLLDFPSFPFMFCLKSPGISAYLYSKFVCIFAIEKRSTGCEGVPFTIRAIVADFEELSHAGKSSTRTSVKDEHLKMEFVDGDSIGVLP